MHDLGEGPKSYVTISRLFSFKKLTSWVSVSQLILVFGVFIYSFCRQISSLTILTGVVNISLLMWKEAL